MKHLLTAAMIALFALSFTVAQESTAKKEKGTTTVAAKSTAKSAECTPGPKGCCAAAKESANMKDYSSMKDCPMMKGATGSKSSNTGAVEKKEEVKTADAKPSETK